MKNLISPRDLETRGRSHVRSKPRRVGEFHAEGSALAHGRRKKRPGPLHVQRVGIGLGEERQPLTHRLLVGGVKIFRLPDIDGHNHAGVGQSERGSLGFAQFGPFAPAGIAVGIIWYLHKVEGKITQWPACAPVPDHRGEQFGVFTRLTDIGFSLIPQHAAERIGHERCNHAIEQSAGRIGGAGANRWMRPRQGILFAGGALFLVSLPPGGVQRGIFGQLLWKYF